MKNLLYIGNKLSQHGASVTSIETLGPLFEGEGYNVFYASSKKNVFLRLLDMLLKVVLLRNKVDVVLIDTYSTSNFWYAFLVGCLARVFKLKYITMLRGGNLPHRLKNNPRLSQVLFGNAYKNVAPSKYLLHHFKLRGFNNIVFIPNTIELERYPIFSKVVEVPHLLWVRSFASIYNPAMAVDVLEKVKCRFPEATLTMVGPDKDGSLDTTKQYALSKGLTVNFTGRLSKEEWIAVSKGFNVFINTTNFDNTPVSVMEAMALGFPIVSTDVGGIPYLLEDTVDALLTHPNDSEAMAEVVLRVVDDVSLRNRLIENGREKVQSWDWEKVKFLWKEVLK